MKISFKDLLSQNQIIIPVIQRDYAQGRTDIKTTKIRKDFLTVIFEAIYEGIQNTSTNGLDLDFIYGFNTTIAHKTTFVPIDGQQRLTTLWLLFWYVAVKENIIKEETKILSHFKYETRHSTTVFCERLLQFTPDFNKNKIVNEIKNQSWYFEVWDFDPSIKAMLVMLNDIEIRYQKLNYNNVWAILIHRQNTFYFNKLDMERVGLPDDLYIKMNSRGKPLTDFEYFKAGFLEIIKDQKLKKRFEDNVDQKWAEGIWSIVLEGLSNKSEVDIAMLVDACFIRLINFISDILAYKHSLPFTEINHSIEETKNIYVNAENLNFLFNSLDCLVELHNNNTDFWDNLFYIKKDGYAVGKSRIYFQNAQVNLLKKCLLNYDKQGKGFSYPEQLLLYACLVHLLNSTTNLTKAIRVVRNLVVNSGYELRDTTIDLSFREVEQFMQTMQFDILDHFKTEQINEEKDKFNFINQNPAIAESIYQLEDSDILRGCISIFDLDDKFLARKNVFVKLFDEDVIQSDFLNRSNLLLCFGDYSQLDGEQTNLLAKAQGVWRTFLTTPAYNKVQLQTNTKVVLMDCLDYFDNNKAISILEKINETLKLYESSPKDWKYYFLKYPGFRENCNKGYYFKVLNNPYPLFKMKEKQFNGYHWDPFLVEIKEQFDKKIVEFISESEIQIMIGNDLLQMESHLEGYVIKNINDANTPNFTFEELIINKEITNNGLFKINQNTLNIDLEDRILKAKVFIEGKLKNIH